MKMRPELEPLPKRMKDLPLDARGYPVPWFVAWVDGEPEFRAMDHQKWARAIQRGLCWCCGEKLGKHLTFVIGPMCGVNLTSSEPPSHLDCARWAARNCPFLTLRQVKRREDETTKGCPIVGGIAISRHPGVTLLWTTRSYKVFRDGKGGYLLNFGPAESVEWYSHGRTATRAEIVASVESGMPFLEVEAVKQEGAMEALAKMKADFEKLYPAE